MSKVEKVEPVVQDDEELLSEEELQDIEKEVNEPVPEKPKTVNGCVLCGDLERV